MERERIWISGVGLVTALGPDVASTWAGLLAGERGLYPLTLFDAGGHRSAMVGAVRPEWEVAAPGGRREAERWSRTSLFAWSAAAQALDAAGLGPGAREGLRVGLVVGGTTGGMFETERLLADLHADARDRRIGSLGQMVVQPLTATADRLAESLGPFCRTRTLCSACSSGANAFVVGAGWLLRGDVDAVVVGGTDGLCRLTFAGFNALAATDPERCRPFDARRRGLNLGEGAGFAVLERAAGLRARKGPVVAELAGWGIGAEAHHITNPEASGAAASRVIERCLRRAGLAPGDVDYVNAHGTATPRNDAMEVAALRLALGREVERVPVSSSKGQIGHTLGAAGAVEAIFSALAVRDQVLPPTMGLEEVDPACALVHVRDRGWPARLRAALSSSFGFGGMDTVLALAEPGLSPGLAPVRAGRVVVTGVAALSPRGLELGDDAGLLLDTPLDDGLGAPPGRLAIDLAPCLDTERSRRMDRPARLGAFVVGRALDAADCGAVPLQRDVVGLVLGTAFGSLDPTAAYLHRLADKGPRLASPAEFPNLVPSSPVGHVSIYHGLRGPTFAIADLGTSGESAVVQAIELLEAGEGDAVVAGAVEEASELVERALMDLHGGRPPGRPRGGRSEGAAALVLEAADHARSRGARPLASVVWSRSWADPLPGRASRASPLASMPAPREAARARVLHVRGALTSGSLDGTPWAKIASMSVAPLAGEHEGLGATALVAAVALVRRGAVAEVLVLGSANGRGYALALEAASHDG